MKNCGVLYLSVLIVLVIASASSGQAPECSVGGTRFACPDGFKPLKTTAKDLRVFKSTGSGDNVFFFVSVSPTAFDPATVGEAVGASYPGDIRKKFSWKTINEPLVMSTETKYKYDLVAFMGLAGPLLIEVKGFVFKIKNRKIVLGYVSDWSENVRTNVRLFEKGQAVGDNAVGCNTVVTTLNSITKEFKDKNQYCFLMTMGAPK